MFILNLVFVHKYQSIQRCTLESIVGKGYGEGDGLRKKCVRVRTVLDPTQGTLQHTGGSPQFSVGHN